MRRRAADILCGDAAGEGFCVAGQRFRAASFPKNSGGGQCCRSRASGTEARKSRRFICEMVTVGRGRCKRAPEARKSQILQWQNFAGEGAAVYDLFSLHHFFTHRRRIARIAKSAKIAESEKPLKRGGTEETEESGDRKTKISPRRRGEETFRRRLTLMSTDREE